MKISQLFFLSTGEKGISYRYGSRLLLARWGEHTVDGMGVGEHGQPHICDFRRQLTPFFNRPGPSASGPADQVAQDDLLMLSLGPWNWVLFVLADVTDVCWPGKTYTLFPLG